MAHLTPRQARGRLPALSPLGGRRGRKLWFMVPTHVHQQVSPFHEPDRGPSGPAAAGWREKRASPARPPPGGAAAGLRRAEGLRGRAPLLASAPQAGAERPRSVFGSWSQRVCMYTLKLSMNRRFERARIGLAGPNGATLSRPTGEGLGVRAVRGLWPWRQAAGRRRSSLKPVGFPNRRRRARTTPNRAP